MYSTTCFRYSHNEARQIAGINANLYTIYSSGRLTSFFLGAASKDGEVPHLEEISDIWRNMNKLGHEVPFGTTRVYTVLITKDNVGMYSKWICDDETKVDNKHVFFFRE